MVGLLICSLSPLVVALSKVYEFVVLEHVITPEIVQFCQCARKYSLCEV